ncbi:Carboxylesterase NlhH [Thalassocella blandensis]|nr:Carboxylesterase NlhH [Thalassocella blandensis]
MQALTRLTTLTLLVCTSLFLGACSKVAYEALNAPSRFSDVDRTKDIVFDTEHKLKLDIYREEKVSSSASLPVIVFFYGGKWQIGEKSEYRFVGSKMAEKGYIAVLPNYRKFPQVQFPDFVNDGAKAVAWVKNNIAQYGGDPSRIYIAGHSAGAHIASLLATDERYLAAQNLNAHSDIKACISISGPYDFEPEKDEFKKIFAHDKAASYHNIQAVNFVDGDEVPMLLLHGKDDNIVKVNQSFFLMEKIKEKGGNAKLISYDDINHINIMTELSWIGPDRAPVLEDIDAFIKAL